MSDPTRSFSHVAPIGTADAENKAMGRAERKPWDYRVTAAIPHLDTIEPLRAAVQLLRMQTERPFIMVVDTGSPPDVCAQLEAMRSHDLEVHFIRAHGYRHTSEPVTAALDLAQTLCRTRHLFHTHADVFLKRRDFLSVLVSLCSANSPAVGYRMSPRNWATDEWASMVGHTALMLYMPSIHRVGATWSFQRIHYGYGYPWKVATGWPDTETAFNRALEDGGIVPVFIGEDVNETQEDENFIHVRSYPGSRIYSEGSTQHQAREDTMRAAIKAAWLRVAEWGCSESYVAKIIPQA